MTGRPHHIPRPRKPRTLEAGDADRPLFWQHLPAPIRALGKERLKWLMAFGDFPKLKRIAPGSSGFWSAKAVQRWSAEHAEWLNAEGKRWAILDAVEAYRDEADDRSGEGLQ